MKYIITGASSGIGKRCAERLLDKGNECLLLARRADKLHEIGNRYKNAKLRPIDLSDLEQIESIFVENKSMFPFETAMKQIYFLL